MADYILRRALSLDDHAESIPAREAITALQALNRHLEEMQPRFEAVPDYHSPNAATREEAESARK